MVASLQFRHRTAGSPGEEEVKSIASGFQFPDNMYRHNRAADKGELALLEIGGRR